MAAGREKVNSLLLARLHYFTISGLLLPVADYLPHGLAFQQRNRIPIIIERHTIASHRDNQLTIGFDCSSQLEDVLAFVLQRPASQSLSLRL